MKQALFAALLLLPLSAAAQTGAPPPKPDLILPSVTWRSRR